MMGNIHINITFLHVSVLLKPPWMSYQPDTALKERLFIAR